MSDLRTAYYNSFSGTVKRFCRLYSLQDIEFIKWLRGGEYLAAEEAVRSYLESPLPAFSGSITDYLLTTHEVVSRLLNTEFSELVFVDGDNIKRAPLVAYVDSYIQERPDTMWLHISNFYYYSFDGLEAEPWFLPMKTKFQVKDGADIDIAYHCGLLDALLPLDIPFTIITRDHFREELYATLTANGRKCEIKSLVESEIVPVEVTLPIEKVALAIEKVEATVQPSMESAELIARYNQLWTGTHGEFCRIYQIDSSNFAKWRMGKKESPCSERAVASYIASLTVKREDSASSNSADV